MKRIISALPGRLAVVALALMAAALMGGVADTDTAVAIWCVDDYDCPSGQFCADPGVCVPYGSPCVDEFDCAEGECCIEGYCVACPEACCFPDDSCGDYIPLACTAEGGSPQGPGTNCATVTCEAAAPEACCLPDGTCMDVDPANCAEAGGVPRGSGTTCADVTCEATPTPTATATGTPTPTSTASPGPSPTSSPTPTEIPEVTETPIPSPPVEVTPPPPIEETATPPPGPPVAETPRPVEPAPPPTPAPDEVDVIAPAPVEPAPGTPEAVIGVPPTGAGSPSGESWPWWPLAVAAGAAFGAAGVLLACQGWRPRR
jgi:hypothetical protein